MVKVESVEKSKMKFLIQKMVQNRLISTDNSVLGRHRWLDSSPEIEEEALQKILNARKALAKPVGDKCH